MVIKAWIPLLFTILISSLLLGFVSLTVGDDRYDYDQCARRCADKPAHERQVCVAACSRRRHRPDGRTVDPRHEIDQCRRRCESQESGKRCRKRCEELYGDRGWEPDMINPSRDPADQFEQECEKRCVDMELGEQKQLQCHQRCVELTKEQKRCQRSCQSQQGRGDHEQCQRTCMQKLEEQVRKQQEQIGRRGENPQGKLETLQSKLRSEEGEMYVLEGLDV